MLIVGCLLIYVSMYGIAGFADLFSLTGTVENFSSYVEVDPGNNIDVGPSNIVTHGATRGESAYLYKDMGGAVTDFTHSVTVEVMVGRSSGVSWVWAVGNDIPWIAPDWPADSGIKQTVGIMFYDMPSDPRIRLYTDEGGTGAVKDNPSREYRPGTSNKKFQIEITKSGTLVNCLIYKYGQSSPEHTLTCTVPSGASYRYVFACATSDYGVTSGTQICKISDLLLDGGVVPPPPPPPAESGTVQLNAWDGANWITGATMSVTWPDNTQTTEQTPYSNTQAPLGAYTVTCTYGGETANNSPQTFQLTAGATVSITFNFGGTTPPPPPPPPNGDDLLDKIILFIEGILDNSTVKTLMLITGVGLAGIGMIALIMPRRRPRPYPPYY